MATRADLGHLYGSTLKSRKVANFELSERSYPPRFQTPKHSHRQALFCLVMQGNYTETFGQQTRECAPATLLFHPPEERHAASFHDAGGRSFVIEIEPEWLDRLREHCNLLGKLLDTSAEFHGGAPALLAQRLYKEFGATDGLATLVIEGLMLEMLGEASRSQVSQAAATVPRWLQQVRELLRARFAESLSLNEIAQTVSVHPMHLAQSFRKTYQCTVGDYVRQLRIEYACHELATTPRPIVEIALAAGFYDQSHFTRTFKRAVGVAPSLYRSSLNTSSRPDSTLI